MVLSSSCLAAVWLDDGRRNVAQSMVSTEVVVGDERVGPWAGCLYSGLQSSKYARQSLPLQAWVWLKPDPSLAMAGLIGAAVTRL